MFDLSRITSYGTNAALLNDERQLLAIVAVYNL